MSQHSPLSEEATLALGYVGAMDIGASDRVREEDERQVLEFAGELERVDERLAVLNGLLRVARDDSVVREAIERNRDTKYGRGLIEIASLDDLAEAGERILSGKNPAIVARAEVWGDKIGAVNKAIAELFERYGKFETVGVEKFPKPSMPTGSSSLHLDNFIHKPTDPGYKYALSAAQLDTGRVLFIGGIAHKKARNTSAKVEGVLHPYEKALLELEADPDVIQLYRSAKNGRPKGHNEFDTYAETPQIASTHIVSAVLNPGDVVIWPQGAEGSEAPAWHAFRKIGNQERSSTSYHFQLTRAKTVVKPA